MQIRELVIYPIKSCRGIYLPEVRLDPRGPALDRRWMVTELDGTFVTLRSEPALARLSLEDAGDAWRLRSEHGETLVPKEHDATRARVRVWRDDVDACAYQPASELVSSHLGRRVQLVYMPTGASRATSSGALVSFADAYPMLLVGQSSLDELNRRLDAPLAMGRFRPNVVVDTHAPHEEDDWHHVTLGAVRCRQTKRCERCAATLVDPRTGETGHEPLRTLATYRKDDGKVWFGINLEHQDTGTLRVGDTVLAETAGSQTP